MAKIEKRTGPGPVLAGQLVQTASAEDFSEPQAPPAAMSAAEALAAPKAETPGVAQTPRQKTPRVLTFFERCASIEKADWGARAQIKVYRLEPIIDRLRSSEHRFITTYTEQIDEQRLKIDHGSGRYRLYLTYKLPSAKEGKELDNVEIDIMDPNYPPNLDLFEWVDDPKNKRWGWAKAKLEEKRQADITAKQQQAQAAKGGMDTDQVIRLLDTIEDRVHRHQPAAAAQPDMADVFKTIVTSAVSLAQSRPEKGNNEEMALLRQQIQDAQARNDRLMEKLLDSKSHPPESGFSLIKDLVGGIKDILPTVKEFFPGAAEAVGASSGHSRMSGTEELIRDIGTELLRQAGPLVQGWGQFAMLRAAQGAQPPRPAVSAALPPAGIPLAAMPGPVPLPAPGPPPSIQAPVPPAMDGMLRLVNDSILNAMTHDIDGGQYAESFETMFGPLQYKQLCALGNEQILALLKTLPMWSELGAVQADMPTFVNQFVHAFDDEAEDTGDPNDAGGAAQPGAEVKP